MATLTGCLKKAGKVIHADDKASILARAKELRADGMATADAAKQAVQEQLVNVAALLEQAKPQVLNQPPQAGNIKPRAPNQEARAQISFGPSIADSGAIISLLENADLSSFVHESGHLFLEIQADLASRIQANIDAGENVTEGERQIVADMGKLLAWFGVKGDETVGGATGGELRQGQKLPANLARAEDQGWDINTRMFHGGGSDFRMFDLKKIGSGAGAQTEGWGIYLSEAKRNASNFGANVYEMIPPGYLADRLIKYDAPYEEQSDFIKSKFKGWPAGEYDDALQRATERLIGKKVGGHKYRVSKGWDLYQALAAGEPGQKPSQRAASQMLARMGVYGAKFRAGSHDLNAKDGDATNYVIWSQDALNDLRSVNARFDEASIDKADFYAQGGEEVPDPAGPSPIGRTPLETWSLMSLDEKRQHHETFARGWERYAFEGNSPNLELQTIFQRFAAWMKSIYRTLTSLNVNLTDEVRGVMDRMIATEEQIKEAETARAMGPLFSEQGGMTPEQWAAYQAQGAKATQTAVDVLQSRALADMKWLSNARAAKLRELQKQADALRRDIRREVTREVMIRPVYRAWTFLTGKGEADQKAQAEPRVKGSSGALDPATDNIFQAIAKLGGLRRDEVQSQWGLDSKAETISSGVFGRPVVRKEGGLSIDMMTEALVSEGYLMADEMGRGDPRDLEESFDSQRMGVDQFSVAHDYAAQVAAANGEAPVEPLPEHITHGKLDTNVLREMHGTQAEAIWRKLSDRRMTSESGIQPDVLAETMGFPSGDAMVRELSDARPPRDLIRDLTDQRMLQEHGELSTPEGLDKATTEALANKVRTRFLAQELQALEDAGKAEDKPGKDGKTRRTASALDKAAEAYAAKTIGAMRIEYIKPHKFEAAATRAAKLAAKAFKAGKTAEAAMHKRSELIQMHAAKAAHEALAEVQKARDHFGDIARRSLDKLGKTYDIDVVQAIRAVLAEYGVGTRGEQAAKYLEAVERNDPDMHRVLQAQIAGLTANAKPIDTLTVDSLRALVDEVGAMWHLARRSKQMEVDGNLIDREEVQAELLARLEVIGIPDTMPGEGKAVTDKERRISRIREAAAALMRVENWAIRKDGADNGVFTRFVFRPIKAASDAYRHERGQVLRKYRDLLAGVNLGVGRISAPELGYEFGFSKGGSGKAELMHAILHTGNDSNKRKLLLGRKWADVMQDGETVDTGRWDRFIERMIREGVLTKADFDFAQGVWDLLESLKPAAQKTHRDVFGRYFDEITANPVTNSLGTWAGGYVPAMTDAEVVKDAKTRDLAEAENSTMAFAFPATAKGFTKARVEYNKPLLLDLRALAGHIDKVLLFSHLEQPVRDVRRVLSSGQVAEPMHKVDPAAFGSLITPWLNRAARQQVETPIPGDGGAMRILSKLRARAGMAAMMANLSNTVQQVAGFSIAAIKVPPRHLMSAAHRYITSPRKTSEAVAEASIYMRDRMDNEAHAMTAEIQQILLNPSLYEKAQDWSARHAYFMQSAVDNVMGPIIWHAAYNHALEMKHSEDDARAMADSTVRTTQGSTLAEDIARIETGNAWWRMFAQFAGYFNMQANLLGTEFSNQMRDLGLRKGMGKGLYIFTLGFLVPALVSELIVQAFRGGPDDEDKDGETLDDWLAALGLGTIRSAIAMVPVAGQAANYAINLSNTKPYDDRISTAPAISMLESAIRAPFSVYEAAANDASLQKAVRDVATLISLTTGLPANAVARPVGYVAGMADDKINPTGPVDAARGLVTGVASPESKQ